MLGAALWAQNPGGPAPSAPAATQGADPIVLSAAGETMTRSQFEKLLASLPANLRGQAATPEGKRQIAERLVEMKILAQEARKRGLPNTPEVAAQLKMQEDNILASAMYQALATAAKPSEADAKAEYDAHKADYEQVKARHILIRFQGSRVPLRKDQKELSDAEALAKAQALRDRIVKGEDFAAVAKAESDDTASGARGGDLGEMTRGRTVPEFEAVLFKIPINEVSAPIKTQYGYHIIQVQSRDTIPFEKVRTQIEGEKAGDSAGAAVNALKEKAGVMLSPDYFGPLAPAEVPAAHPAPGTPAPAAPAVKK
jgi:parvulin-like peptidyl-prolyl isomerase